MAGFISDPRRLESNNKISYIGKLRQCLPYISLQSEELIKRQNHHSIDKPDFYFFNHFQVANWARSVGLGQFAPLFLHHLINGRKLLVLDTIALEKLGSKNNADNLKMEAAIRNLSQRFLRESETYEKLPYFTTQALNLGHRPPQRFHRELSQFTDPWLTEACNFVDISASDL